MITRAIFIGMLTLTACHHSPRATGARTPATKNDGTLEAGDTFKFKSDLNFLNRQRSSERIQIETRDKCGCSFTTDQESTSQSRFKRGDVLRIPTNVFSNDNNSILLMSDSERVYTLSCGQKPKLDDVMRCLDVSFEEPELKSVPASDDSPSRDSSTPVEI